MRHSSCLRYLLAAVFRSTICFRMSAKSIKSQLGCGTNLPAQTFSATPQQSIGSSCHPLITVRLYFRTSLRVLRSGNVSPFAWDSEFLGCQFCVIMQIMCLVSGRTREAAQERNACAVLLSKLEADVEEGTLAGACLDTLMALLADSPLNQQAFLAQQGLARVTLSCLRISEGLHPMDNPIVPSGRLC